MTNVQLIDIVRHFCTEGTVISVEPMGKGLINDTFLVKIQETDKPDYVLQRINHHIFTDVELLQHNTVLFADTIFLVTIENANNH